MTTTVRRALQRTESEYVEILNLKQNLILIDFVVSDTFLKCILNKADLSTPALFNLFTKF